MENNNPNKRIRHILIPLGIALPIFDGAFAGYVLLTHDKGTSINNADRKSAANMTWTFAPGILK